VNGQSAIVSWCRRRLKSWLVCLLALGLFIGEGSRSFARADDPGLLYQQVLELYQEGKFQQAIPLAEKLLAIKKRALGPEDPSIAQSLNNLAILYQQMGAYAKAEPLFEQALQINQKALGPEHPDTATSLNNLAELYRAQGQYGKAEPLYEQAHRRLELLALALSTRRGGLRTAHNDSPRVKADRQVARTRKKFNSKKLQRQSSFSSIFGAVAN
jgi:tetratricopeptide (TPR) repeat protein